MPEMVNEAQRRHWNDASRLSAWRRREPLTATVTDTLMEHAAIQGGRLAFVCWQAMADNPWFTEAWASSHRHLAPLLRADGQYHAPLAFQAFTARA
jgi:hypothetical protein